MSSTIRDWSLVPLDIPSKSNWYCVLGLLSIIQMDIFKFHLRKSTNLGERKKSLWPWWTVLMYAWIWVCVCVYIYMCYRCACVCVCMCCRRRLQPVTALLSGHQHCNWPWQLHCDCYSHWQLATLTSTQIPLPSSIPSPSALTSKSERLLKSWLDTILPFLMGFNLTNYFGNNRKINSSSKAVSYLKFLNG